MIRFYLPPLPPRRAPPVYQDNPSPSLAPISPDRANFFELPPCSELLKLPDNLEGLPYIRADISSTSSVPSVPLRPQDTAPTFSDEFIKNWENFTYRVDQEQVIEKIKEDAFKYLCEKKYSQMSLEKRIFYLAAQLNINIGNAKKLIELFIYETKGKSCTINYGIPMRTFLREAYIECEKINKSGKAIYFKEILNFIDYVNYKNSLGVKSTETTRYLTWIIEYLIKIYKFEFIYLKTINGNVQASSSNFRLLRKNS